MDGMGGARATRDVLAIVGSTDWEGAEVAFAQARAIIVTILSRSRPDEVISGGAIGIDQAAVAIAQAMGISTSEIKPEFPRWAPRGYMARNTLIARRCTRMVCIRNKASKTYGSGWTANRAESYGKPVERHLL